MARTCPGCGSTLKEPNSQAWCSSCSEPINVDVNRERIRRHADGFLGRSERGLITKAVRGERPSPKFHEYTQVAVQEQARQAKHDFWLLAECDAIDSRDVIIGEVHRVDFHERADDETLADMLSILGLFRLLVTSLSIPALKALLELSMRQEIEKNRESVDEAPNLDVEIRINGKPGRKGLESLDL